MTSKRAFHQEREKLNCQSPPSSMPVAISLTSGSISCIGTVETQLAVELQFGPLFFLQLSVPSSRKMNCQSPPSSIPVHFRDPGVLLQVYSQNLANQFQRVYNSDNCSHNFLGKKKINIILEILLQQANILIVPICARKTMKV